MKKYTIIVLIILVTLLVSCGSDQVSVDDFAIKESIQLANKMKVFSEDETYIESLIGGFDLSAITDVIKEQDHSVPETAVIYQLSKEEMLDAYSKSTGTSVNSDSLREKILKRTNGMMLTHQINSKYGVELQVFNSITTWGKSYLQPENWEDTVIVFLEYEGEYSMLVSYEITGDGVISSNASYVKNVDGEAVDKLESFFDSVKKTEYTKDQITKILGDSK